jgi:hypothetical protein
MTPTSTRTLRYVLLLALGMFTHASHALLIDNLDGTITQERSDGSVLMWLQDGNYIVSSGYSDALYDYPALNGRITLLNAFAFIDQLNADAHLGYTDWRLPVTYDCFPHHFEWCGLDPRSEMGYMFYAELGNIGYCSDATGECGQPGSGLTNAGPFTNLQTESAYWTSTIESRSTYPGYYIMWFLDGLQDANSPDIWSTNYVWPVRTVTAVPLPAALWLFVSGALALAGLRGVRRRHA